MGGPVVQDEVKAFDLTAPQASEDHLEESLELDKALTLRPTSDGLTFGNQQGREQLQSTFPLISVSDPGSRARDRWVGSSFSLPCLNGRHFIHADRDVAFPGQRLCLLVELQNRYRFLQKAWIGGFLPSPNLPGLDFVLPQPASDGAPRNA
jgi:hypothetical protein